MSNTKKETKPKTTKSRVTKTKKDSHKKTSEQTALEQTLHYEKQIYDLEQLLDIAKSFCQNIDFTNLLESIVYVCMAQMHVLGTEIFVRDLISNEVLKLETSKDNYEKPLEIPITSNLTNVLLQQARPVTLEELKHEVKDCEYLDVISQLNPTLIIPLIQKNHLNGILVLQERIAIEDDTAYTDYEKDQMMSIASLASVAINNAVLLEAASTDMMTHLKIKYYFFNMLTEAIDNAFLQNQNLSVLMFDIDFFKKFNDTYGHECGDFVLINVADLIRKNLRDTDMASRYGGEEFTVLLNDTGKEDAMLVAERIRSAVDEHDFHYNGQHLHVTISVGVTVFDAEKNLVKSPNELVNQADQGLYLSKNNGRNMVTYFEPKK